ncbi:family 20 glycosylhydrolase [Cerasicoccus maritimus]|uniref:family 20 glycosylhydrolase n=1 Tax=Cerasicoccus maritimus TaxID=490089 RepID=UPI002852A693|nr:family 20 glycosylhydrolase [Cerasicoccus maritimus]
MLDSARCMENREYYRRFIRFCASRNLNTILWHFSDDQGVSMDFPSEPGLAGKHAYSSEEMSELISYAEDRGITIIPELETLGHSRYITGHAHYQHLCESDGDFTAMCPIHPDTRSLMKRLLADVAAIFPSPWIHVGLDEIKLGGHPLTQEALATKCVAELLLDYVTFIYDEVTALSRQMIMWVDQNSFDAGFIHGLSREIILAVWQYNPDVKPDLAQRLIDDGFSVILCPAMITYDQQAYPGNIALPNIERMSRYQQLCGNGKVMGALTTIWTPMRYLHDALWPALGIAADTMLSQGRLDAPQSVAKHIREFHGVEPDPLIVEAITFSFEIAPERKEYLSVLKADPNELDEHLLVRRSKEWAQISDHISSFLPRVKREYASIETLKLFAAWMSYLYRRSALLKARGLSREAWEKLTEEGGKWLGKLEQIWDRERFADDHRRFSPVFGWEENEYLLINFRQSLQVTEAQLPHDLVPSHS